MTLSYLIKNLTIIIIIIITIEKPIDANIITVTILTFQRKERTNLWQNEQQKQQEFDKHFHFYLTFKRKIFELHSMIDEKERGKEEKKEKRGKYEKRVQEGLNK